MKSSDEVKLAVMAEQIKNTDANVTAIRNALEKEYVTRGEWDPYKRVIQLIGGILLSAVVGAILKLIILR